MENLGNQLYRIVNAGRGLLFDQSELAELTYSGFELAAAALKQLAEETITINFPVGWRADNQPMPGNRTYYKNQLHERYQFLAFHQLAVNGLIQIVVITEALLSDVVRAVVVRYPQKLGGKRTVQMQMVLEASSLEDVHLRAVDALLNELSYKSASDFADEIKPLLGIGIQRPAGGSCPYIVPDKQANNRDVVVAGVELTPQRAIRYQGRIRGRQRLSDPDDHCDDEELNPGALWSDRPRAQGRENRGCGNKCASFLAAAIRTLMETAPSPVRLPGGVRGSLRYATEPRHRTRSVI
jgi:hypothetical protein